MIQIVIIGAGNVAQHLIMAFAKCNEVAVTQVYSRKQDIFPEILSANKVTNNIQEIKDADLYIIAVSDTAIADVSSQLPFKNKLVVHTSGSVAIDDLSNNNRKGVFYPLQSFSKNKEVNFLEIPICIEAQNEEDFKLLEKVASAISDKVYNINSDQRKALHVAAVFVNNFTNYMYQIGNEICKENNIDFQILHPLILETANKLKTLSPNEAQTGPAKRNDTTTINSQLNFLSNPNFKDIYKLLTKSIIDNGNKL